jgi:UDP-N-acetylmuramyl pentapeptide phosphotransferase/UDP-N-acetylglucosamine-1-phosphate transferase
MNLTFALQILGIGFLALVLSYLGVIGLRGWAGRRQIVDVPSERSSHTQPTLRGGGLAIVIVTLSGWLLYTRINSEWPWFSVLAYLVGAVLVGGVSWLDDLRSLPNRVRFAAHTIGAILIILGFGYWQTFGIPFLGSLYLGWFGFVITFLWIVGLTNAYNFMDGIDGIAGGQAVVAGLGWAVLGRISGQPLTSVLGLLLAASSLGFLGHNWPPARIFMGDVGSAFLGYTLAVLPTIAGVEDSRLILAGLLLVWPFVFDTAFTFLKRLFKGENVFVAHRSHLYQRLVIVGYSHRFVTLLYIGLALIGVILAFAWSLRVEGSAVAISLVIPLLCLGLWVFVIRQERIRAVHL